jgi:hypothetical protein
MALALEMDARNILEAFLEHTKVIWQPLDVLVACVYRQGLDESDG